MRNKLMVGLVVFVVAAGLAIFVGRLAGSGTPNCSELPDATVVADKGRDLEILHTEVVRITGGAGVADFDTERCPGRVELHIAYPGEADKPKLVDLWQRSPLKDIPVHWQNV